MEPAWRASLRLPHPPRAACRAGDYRQQLRARHLVRRGDCVASVFPFSRRDGPVGEVLMFDGGPRDADKRILTVQVGGGSRNHRKGLQTHPNSCTSVSKEGLQHLLRTDCFCQPSSLTHLAVPICFAVHTICYLLPTPVVDCRPRRCQATPCGCRAAA